MKPIERKMKEGLERKEYWDSLTPQEKLKDLDRRLGVGQGAVRQRAKLEAIINKKGEV